MVAETPYGVARIHGHVSGSFESITSNFEFITITTKINILPLSASGTAKSQAALDKLIEIVSLRGQPVIMGAPAVDTGTYTVMMAVEHPSAWQSAGYTSTSNNALRSRIIADGINFGFGANVSVSYTDPVAGTTATATVDDTGSSYPLVAFSNVLT